MSTIARAFLVFFALFTVAVAFGRLELQDRMQMSRFHEPEAGNGDDAYIRYLSDYFGQPPQKKRAFAPATFNK